MRRDRADGSAAMTNIALRTCTRALDLHAGSVERIVELHDRGVFGNVPADSIGADGDDLHGLTYEEPSTGEPWPRACLPHARCGAQCWGYLLQGSGEMGRMCCLNACPDDALGGGPRAGAGGALDAITTAFVPRPRGAKAAAAGERVPVAGADHGEGLRAPLLLAAARGAGDGASARCGRGMAVCSSPVQGQQHRARSERSCVPGVPPLLKPPEPPATRGEDVCPSISHDVCLPVCLSFPAQTAGRRCAFPCRRTSPVPTTRRSPAASSSTT